MKLSVWILFFATLSLAIFAQENNNNEEEILKYNQPGFDYLLKGDFENAEFYLLKALELQEAYLGKNDPNTAATNINLGVMYRNLNNYQVALKYLNIAEKYFIENDPNSHLLGYIYNNKGNVYYNYSDYKEAEFYYRYSLKYFEENKLTNLNAYSQAVINLFNILITQDRHEEAMKFLDSQKSRTNDCKVSFNRQMFLAESYSRLQNYKQALIEVEQAKNIYYDCLDPNLPYLMMYNYRVASIYVEMGDYSKAIWHLLNNIKLSEDSDLIHFEKLYQSYLLIGTIHYLKGDYENCIAWLTRVINRNQLSETEDDPSNNLLSSKTYNKDIIDFYRLYGNAAHKLYIETGNIDYLKVSLENYEKSIEYIKVFRIHMRNKESIHLESEARIEIIHEAVNIAAILYKITGSLEDLEKGFMYAENMKSFSLFTDIKGGEAMQFSNLPTKIMERESMFTRKLGAYSELIYNEKSKINPSRDLIKRYDSIYFEIKNDYNSLQDSIENLYPKYFNLKYNPTFITPTAVQKKLERKEALVEYVLSDSVLTTFIIDKHQIKVLTRDIGPDFSEDCFAYFSLLQNQDFSKDVHDTYREYVRMARNFYEVLVAPVLEVTESREITFIPDGAIMYLPFESFLTEKVDNEYIKYNELPYLIFDVSVGYSHSSTMLFSERIKNKSPEHKVLAFAPAYENLLGKNQILEMNRQANPDMLMPLPGARQEVYSISKTVPSVVFKDSLASESNFKKYASDYSILHLAMHTIMNDDDPMFSKLAFTRNWSDTLEDHNLYTYEIYNMKLNAEMVVLSSCSSGFGKMQKGEGMMSMARGFVYAGCPSIVMTLWQVSDRSSSDLMSSFYKYLKKGNSKKKSLRKAKIDYIKSADNLKSNPYFWSAFLLVGDSSPLYGASAATYYIIIIAGFILIVLFLTYKKQILRLIGRRKK